MRNDVSQGSERVRSAEMIAALCLATDLGMGFPFEHGLHSTLIAARLAGRLGLDRVRVSQTYYACLLSHSGCTTDAHVAAEVFGGSLTTHLNPVMYGSTRETVGGLLRALPDPDRPGVVRAAQVARRLPKMAREQRPALTATCEVAQMLGSGLALPPSVQGLLAHLFERWDGKGPLGRARGDEIPLPMRIVHVAIDAAFQRRIGGVERAARIVRERAGHAFDPEVAACLAGNAEVILALNEETSAWEETLACEPRPHAALEGEAIDHALEAMGGFADLISPSFTGHSAGVAELAGAAATRCRIDAFGALAVRRAALVHDLGRVAVGAKTWQKPGPLSADEWERVRLHAYHTERVLSRPPFLAELAPVAGAHHERVDGSGYHRGSSGAELTMPARLLAAADAYHAMTEPRPHRDALAPEQAAKTLGQEASAGRLDADAVAAVIAAAGQRVPRIERPAGLTEREAEVVGMLARGLQTKQVAHELGIAVKTADRHIQNAYAKMGVSTRAAATLFAMQHGLAAWGELPISIAAVVRSVRSSSKLDEEGAVMAKMKSEATIARPVEDVFRFFLDLDDNAPKTDPSVESVVKTPDGPTGPGTTFRLRQHSLGKQRETTTRFTAVQPNRRIEFEARIGPMRPTCSLSFHQTDEGTRVTFAGDSNPIGPMKLFSALLDRKGQHVWTQRLARIKTVLETTTP